MVFSDLDLARRLERAEGESCARFAEARAAVFPQSGACWIEVSGAYAVYDGVASPVTQTFGLGLFEPVADAELDQIEAFFRDRGAPVFHEVSPLAGIPMAVSLCKRGYEPVEFSSVMWRPLDAGQDLAQPRNEKIRARRIHQREHAVFAETTAKGWSDYPELAGFLEETGPIIVHRADSTLFLAELDGKPIAAAALCTSAGVALLAGACTILEGRRQGAQLALLEIRLRHAAGQGCDIAMMCAAPGGASQRNAERHGFRVAYTRTKWVLGSVPLNQPA